MTNWKAGDIITDEKWDKLNDVYPLFKKINIAEDSTSSSIIFDIQKDELQDLLENGVSCWFKLDNDSYTTYISPYDISLRADGRVEYTLRA